MSATAKSHVEEVSLTWLDKFGYAIPARRAAPSIGIPPCQFFQFILSRPHTNPPIGPQGSHLYSCCERAIPH